MADLIRSTVNRPRPRPRATDLPLPARYARTSRWLHWLMAGLVILAYLLIDGRGWFPKGSTLRTLFVQGHFWIGLLVLALVLPRLLARLRNPVQPLQPPLSPLPRLLSGATHLALYGFLLAQPLMGVTIVLLERGGIPLGGLTLASPFALDKAMAQNIEAAHVFLGEAFYYVIGLHIAAALWHHFYRRDQVLQRML